MNTAGFAFAALRLALARLRTVRLPEEGFLSPWPLLLSTPFSSADSRALLTYWAATVL